MIKGYTHAHGAWFETRSDHGAGCAWCRQAHVSAEAHMKDHTQLTVKSTKYEPGGNEHKVVFTRVRDTNIPAEPLYRFTMSAGGGGGWGSATTAFSENDIRASYGAFAKPVLTTTDEGLAEYFGHATPNERKLILALQTERAERVRLKPVVLDMTLQEAAVVVQAVLAAQNGAEEVAASTLKGASTGADILDAAALRQRAGLAKSVWKRLNALIGKELDRT